MHRAIAAAVLVGLGSLSSAARAAPGEACEAAESEEDPQLRDALTREAMRLGTPEGMEPSSGTGALCVANCAAGYAALCLAITRYCATASVITIGGASVPCATAIAATCIGGAALQALCARSCPP